MKIYMDETETQNGYFGYGALITKKYNEFDQIIADSFSLLSNAENKNQKDEEVIKRGYFHAKEDTPNAHSAICHGVEKINNTKFTAHFLDPKVHGNNREELFDKSAFYSLFELNHIREPVTIIMENRKELNKDIFQNKFLESYNELLLCCYDQPMIPLSFPKIEFKIADKNTSGLQLCDFLLWASGRKLWGNNVWHDRIRALFKYEAIPESKNFYEFTYFFMREKPQEVTFYEISDYDPNFGKKVSDELLWNLFVEAQALIKSYSNNNLPEHITHLKKDIKKFCNTINNGKYINQIKETAELYLKLFDTIPIIDESTPKDKKPLMLYTKQFMGLLLNRKYNQSIRMTDFFACNLKAHDSIN